MVRVCGLCVGLNFVSQASFSAVSVSNSDLAVCIVD